MKQLILLVFAGIITCNASAQQTDFSGNWKMTDIKSLSGDLYGNAVPKQIEIKQYKDSIILITTEADLFPCDIVGTERVKINGNAVASVVGKKSRKRTLTIQLDKEGLTATRTCSLYQEDGKSIYVTYTDTYAKEGDKLTVQRKAENFTNGETWEAFAVFEEIRE